MACCLSVCDFAENDAWRKCRSKDDDGCFFYYSYEYASDKVKAQREKGIVMSRLTSLCHPKLIKTEKITPLLKSS